MVEYNGVAVAFAKDFRKWLRKSSFAGSVQSTDGNKNLGDVIPGDKCRRFFERFLNSSQWDSAVLPSHPSDIEKLVVFICAVFRHGASVDVSEIERFLITDMNWKPADAAWVRVRITAGLDVLKVDRSF
jgi:hypothetical protein